MGCACTKSDSGDKNKRVSETNNNRPAIREASVQRNQRRVIQPEPNREIISNISQRPEHNVPSQVSRNIEIMSGLNSNNPNIELFLQSKLDPNFNFPEESKLTFTNRHIRRNRIEKDERLREQNSP